MSQDIADLCFPDITQNKQDIVACYPDRPQGQVVTRFAPSPTGFLHLGGLYASLINTQFAHQQGGIFMLRMEDTDQQRLVHNGIHIIISALAQFGIYGDEWADIVDLSDTGMYGPYIQSHRKLIYQTIAKELIAQGKAYPCFLTPQEIEQTKLIQTASKQLPWIYGDFAPYRHTSAHEVALLIQEWKPFVIRLLCTAQADDRVQYIDLIKWAVSAQANINDVVLIKSDGLTTYHFAHVVDDYLMGTTHVIRADEWVPSVPLHIQLTQTVRWSPPRRSYAHVAPLLKSDKGGKRKLSKSKDPEADVMYLIQAWYPTEAIKEYLMTIIDSKYEDWKTQNLTNTYTNYQLVLSNMNVAGALVDMLKLRDVSKEYIASLSSQQLYDQLVVRCQHGFCDDIFDKSDLDTHASLIISALGIERWDPLKDPKRFVTYRDMIQHIRPFVNTLYEKDSFPEISMQNDEVVTFVDTYLPLVDLTLTKDQRFDQLKDLWSKLGYATTNQEAKSWWYKGKIGDLAMILRVALFKSTQTPDLYQSMLVMWSDTVRDRLLNYRVSFRW
jgi:glutamyl-tRNA synthetase